MKPLPLTVLIAPDKFKGSLSASNVAQALADGIAQHYPSASFLLQPMADGGDGSIDLLQELWALKLHWVKVRDPLGRQIKAPYYSSNGTAFIEMAKASGLALLKEEERNCLETSSFGTGELILDALSRGFREIRLFIGGSATTDAAMGIATALGYQFLDQKGQLLDPIGNNLLHVHYIKNKPLQVPIDSFNIQVVCDVNNPFYGPSGAAHVYARQKGADDQAIELLDQGLKNINQAFQRHGLADVQAIPGAGAAGGVGGGIKALFGGQLIAGIDLFIDLFDLKKKVEQADWVISGEGRLDMQSLEGKVVGGIARLCQADQKPLTVVCGQNQLSLERQAAAAITSVQAISERADSVEDAIQNAEKYLRQTGERLRFG